MPDNLNLAPYLITVIGCTVGAAAVATPVLWRALRRERPARRVLLTTIGSFGLAGILAIALEAYDSGQFEALTLVVPVLSLLLQLLLVPVLIFLVRCGRS